MNIKRQQLIKLYRQMADLTLPECQHTCRVPLNCCSPEYCMLAIEHAKTCWNVILQSTGHDRLPLMGSHGCIAAPHLRPLCTMYTCQINSYGCKPNDPAWTNQYFELRDAIVQLENEIEQN